MSQMNQMTQMFGQMMFWPMTMFADMVSRSMQGMQGTSCGSSGTCTSTCSSDDRYISYPPKQLEGSRSTSSRGSREERDDWSCRDRCDDGWTCDSGSRGEDCGCGCGCNRCRGGDCCRSSSHRGSDKVWLVEYSIVDIGRSFGRGAERSVDVPCQQRLIRDCMSCEEFKNWVIADYVRKHEYVDGKNLRVYVKVLDSWCKEDWDYEEEQIRVLREIRTAIRADDGNQERSRDRDTDRNRDREAR